MQVEILRNNTPIAGPIEFDATSIRDIVMRQGADYRLIPNGFTGKVVIGPICIKPVQFINPELARDEIKGAVVRTETESLITYTYSKATKDTDDIRQELLRSLSQIHEAYDTSDTEHRGVRIRTNLEARVNAMGSLSSFSAGQLTQTIWNGLDGVITVNSLSEMQALYSAIFQHIAVGFAAKTAVRSLIKNASTTDLKVFNVDQSFETAVSQAKAAISQTA